MKKLAKQFAERFGLELRRPPPRSHSVGHVTLAPQGAPAGRCLLAYILQPFLAGEERIDTSHTHFLESRLMADVWTGLGFEVDVIDYRNAQFQPARHYDYFVSARRHLADLAPRLGAQCVKIAHLDTAHFATNNAAAFQRLLSFQERKGITVPESIRIIESNRGIDAADHGVLLGSAVTASSYAYAGKPIHLLDVPAAVEFPWDGDKDFGECAKRFLWLGSSGLLHKGLDLVVEAFLDRPDLELNVCGPVDQEPALLRAYERELAYSPNIRIHGWTDVASRQFLELTRRCGSIVYPSCGEGQAGSVVTALRAGLVPLISPQTGLDVGEFGELIQGFDSGAVRNAIDHFAGLPAAELEARARCAWETGERRHSRQAYRERYCSIVERIVAESPGH